MLKHDVIYIRQEKYHPRDELVVEVDRAYATRGGASERTSLSRTSYPCVQDLGFAVRRAHARAPTIRYNEPITASLLAASDCESYFSRRDSPEAGEQEHRGDSA